MIEVAKAFLLLGAAALWLSSMLLGRRRVSDNAAAGLSAGWIFVALAGLSAAGALPATISDVATPAFAGVSLSFLVTAAIAAGPLVLRIAPHMPWWVKSLVGWAMLFGLLVLYTEDAQRSQVMAAPLLLVAVAAPAQALASWTASDRHVYARSVLQSLIWVALLLWIFPSMALAAEGRDWSEALQRTSRELWLWLVPLALPASLVIAALWQFASEGNGTGFPYDPPKRLVCHGIYAHISNPMQLGIVLLMGWWGVVLQSPVVLVSAPVAALLFIVFSGVCSGISNVAISDPKWRRYKRDVPSWRPRASPWRPPPDETPA